MTRLSTSIALLRCTELFTVFIVSHTTIWYMCIFLVVHVCILLLKHVVLGVYSCTKLCGTPLLNHVVPCDTLCIFLLHHVVLFCYTHSYVRIHAQLAICSLLISLYSNCCSELSFAHYSSHAAVCCECTSSCSHFCCDM